MARLGSDVDQMEDLALVIEREANRMRSSAGEINSMMRDLAWWGPFHNFFLGWWDSKQYKWLVELADSLDGLGQTARRQATEQTQASMSQEFRSNDPALTKFMYSTTFEGSKKIGLGGEYLPEYSINASYFLHTDEEGIVETRGNTSVFVADKWGIELEEVVMLATGGVYAAQKAAVDAVKKIAGDTLFGGGPKISGSISGGFGREYRWYDQSNSQIHEIYKHNTGQTTSTSNRLGTYAKDDVESSIKAGDIPEPDSFINWAMVEAEIGIDFSLPLGANLAVGTGASLMYGTEIFDDGHTAKIIQGDLSVTGLADAPVIDLFKEDEYSGIGGEIGGSVERKLIFDNTGRPVSLEITDTYGVETDSAKGWIVKEVRTADNSLVTKYTYDLTDRNVFDQLNVGNGDDLLGLSERALDKTDLAYGESHILDSDGHSVNVDLLYTLGMVESGETGRAKDVMVKPVGEAEFTPQ